MKRLVFGLSLAALTCSSALAQTATTSDLSSVLAQAAPRPAQAAPAAGLPAGAPMPPYTYEPGPRKGDWEATIGGSGISSNQFNGNAIGLGGYIGYYPLKWLPVRLQQDFNWVFGDKVKNRWLGSTSVFADAQWNAGNWFQPFIGFGFGGIYGHDVDQSVAVAPEAGFKAYVNESTFILGRFAWAWHVTGNNTNFKDGDAIYSLGVGFNF